ncbi:MAG: metalloprotease PmbA, partial [Rhizobacter sp.]|nr:metalloprotease PmbA [Rhizobacter sp.]
MPIATAAPEPTSSGFAYSRAQFRELVQTCLDRAKALGASDAVAEVSEGVGLSFSVRKGETENIERNRDKSISVTVYVGKRRGNASTSDFSPAALEQTVKAAHDIARFTSEDPAAGLPEEADLADAEAAARDLDLFHPWVINAEQAIALATRCEGAALAVDSRITNSEGSGVSAQQSHFFTANTRGFGAGYASSRHSLSVAPIASLGDDMQRDAWYTSMRSADELAAPEVVGRYAAERALSRLQSRKITTRQVPVLFESSLASTLLGAYVQATSGGSLYRKSSFLLDSIGKRVLPEHIDIREDPHLPRGKGSAPFDDEGVATRPALIVDAGVVQSYFLSSYSAR